MARRNLLHRNKLEEFKQWLEKRHLTVMPPKGCYEVLRFKHPEDGFPMPIIYNGKSPDHLSCNESAITFVKRFIRDSKC